jgi:hypothetical protein
MKSGIKITYTYGINEYGYESIFTVTNGVKRFFRCAAYEGEAKDFCDFLDMKVGIATLKASFPWLEE